MKRRQGCIQKEYRRQIPIGYQSWAAKTGADVIAINEDGTLNSAENPAASGSIIKLFVTGLGQTNPPLRDGRIAQSAALPRMELAWLFFQTALDKRLAAKSCTRAPHRERLRAFTR